MHSLCSLSSWKLCWTSLDDKRRTRRTTGWFTCVDTDLLQHKTCLQNDWKISCVKSANYQDTESSDMDQPHCSYSQKMKMSSFQQEWGLLLLAHFPGTSMGTELSALHFVPSTLCLWLCQCVCLCLQSPHSRTNPPRATKCEQQHIPALNRTQAPSQLQFYRDREKKSQLHNSTCKSVKYSSMKGCK